MAGGLEAIVCSDDVALFRTAWREAVNGCYEQEYRIRKGDGQVIWVLEKGRLVVDGEGEPCASACSSTSPNAKCGRTS